MRALRALYRIGNGPSSSHTMAPARAARLFAERRPDAAAFRLTLYGSLAATGRGHLLDRAVSEALAPRHVEFVWLPETTPVFHPNGMAFEVLDGAGNVVGSPWKAYSIGGGALADEDGPVDDEPDVYDLTAMADILAYCGRSGRSLWEYAVEREGPGLFDDLDTVWTAMTECTERGLRTEGALPGGLGVARKAWSFHRRARSVDADTRETALVSAYALAVAEENASGRIVVTAPTCGSAGVVPAVLRYARDECACERDTVLRALATAGLIGNLVKHNASISGAVVGCQGEIGTACAMAAGAAAQILGGSPRQIEYAAEMGLEHHLGLTCDPVGGLVQIPCIERNAFAATRALDCARYAVLSDGSHQVPFDAIVQVMRRTGHDLPSIYRETSGGGLASELAPDGGLEPRAA